jgi:hypothetical protein
MTTEVRESTHAHAHAHAHAARGARGVGAHHGLVPLRFTGMRPVALHLMILLGYTLLTLALTYPVPWKLSTEVPGGGDAWQHIWNLWWVKHALLERHTNPYHTDLLYYPYGVNLYLHTLVLSAGLPGILLQLLGFNLIATYNLILLSSFVLAGYGMYLLCRHLTGNGWASFVGGLVFAFSPYHFAHLFGHMNLASLQWIPFYVLVLLKATEAGVRPVTGGRLRPLAYAAGAGALLALNAYTDWVYGIFLTLLTGILLVWKALVPSERRALALAGMNWREGTLRLAAGAGAFVLLMGPVLLPTLAEARQGYAQQPPIETLVYSSDVILAFMPSELHPVWGEAIRRQVESIGPYLPMKNPSERVVFVGYTVLLVAGYAVWRLWRDRRVRFWAFVAVAMWVLSLGPVLQVLGRTKFTAFEVSVPLPYLLLYKLPMLNVMRTPARLTVLVMLALGVLVAFGLAILLSRPRTLWRPLLPMLVVPALVLFEFLAVPFPTVPPGWGVPIYAKIAQEPGRFALLELPLRPFGDYMAYQTIHGKPIIGGYLSRQPPYRLPEEVPAIRYLLNTTPVDDSVKALVGGGAGVRSLRDLGVKYVIIRWWAFTEQEREAMRTKLDVLLGRPPDYTYPRDMVDVWQLTP